MSDREMIELAALAAGLVIEYQNGVPCVMKTGGWPFPLPWSPLTDDGEALRLAVKLRIDFYEGDDDGKAAYAGYFVGSRQKFMVEPHGDDPYAATRRAITRAAAEIGKTMKGGAA